MTNTAEKKRLSKAGRDIITLGIAVAAIILFVGTGGRVLPDVMRSILGDGGRPDFVLVNALLLNIALIIFGWRRYRELTTEVADRRKAEKVAQKLAETDPLTDCLNRRSMAQATQALIAKSRKTSTGVAMIVVDVDNFKQINDMHGHAAGDAALIEVSSKIRTLLPPASELARTGGDEFAIIVPFIRNDDRGIEELCHRICQVTAKTMDLDGITVDMTVSAGVATTHDPQGKLGEGGESIDPETLNHRADIAMYHAKKQGKNRFSFFELTMEDELRFRNELEVGVRRGIERGEFVPYYEQQVDIESDELVGFEMLARWQSPELGIISPEIFIAVAEEIGVIGKLSEQLIAQAFADAREWDPSITLSVNISPVQMRDPWFAQKLVKLMVEQQFPPHRLEIEVTESCLHDNVSMVRSTIASLRNQGVMVSLDDFGTGYSSLSQLRSLEFDRLKIDRSFVAELSEEEACSKIVDAIVSLGTGLDMTITAEGIEDEKVLDTLKGLGNFKGQGFHYGRPETAEQVRKRLSGLGKLPGMQSPNSPDVDEEITVEDFTQDAKRAGG
ncbi:MAG: EAL domain-containing protein [Erythrobacter sp.]